MRKTILALAAATALSVLPPGAWAAAPKAAADATQAFHIDKGRIDQALAAMVTSGRAVGVSALVWQDGQERYFGTSGFADRETKRPMARDTMVQVFSMTKPVTGVALMQLWEQGKFGLDDPLANYLPEYADVKVLGPPDASGQPTLRPPARPITVRDILRHTAGFSYGMRPTAADAAFKAADPMNLGNDLAEFSRRNAKVPLLFDPGTQWNYSVGVDVQAALVEKLSGQPFEAYVRQHVLDPLKMTSSGWTQPEARFPRMSARYAKGKDGKLAREPDAAARALNFDPARKLTMGGAGLAGPIDDYMRFARMLLNGGSLDGVRILKPSTVKLMSTDQLDARVKDRFFLPTKGQVGFGFDFAVRTAQPASPTENRGAVGEFFWDGAATTLFWVDPANKLTAVFFVQTLPFDPTLHHDIRAAVYGPTYLGPKGD
jgi:CubicO group peptidase (beta-lactamase class C family)